MQSNLHVANCVAAPNDHAGALLSDAMHTVIRRFARFLAARPLS